jgi:hypothetical protein
LLVHAAPLLVLFFRLVVKWTNHEATQQNNSGRMQREWCYSFDFGAEKQQSTIVHYKNANYLL